MSTDAVVVGGGLIGLASAWRAAEAGMRVTLVDPAPATAASQVAAGMLAPVGEVDYGERDLLRLNIASSERWPAFADDLERASGADPGYRQTGTLLVGFDDDDARVLEDMHRFREALDLRVERLSSRRCRSQEPALSPRVRTGLAAPDDHQADPRQVLDALQSAVAAGGVEHRPEPVARIDHDGGRVTGVTTEGGAQLSAPWVVLAAGAASADIGGLPPEVSPPVRPVKGQLLRLRHRGGDPVLSGVVRGIVGGRRAYLVPRGDGRLVVGATQEEVGADTTVTAGAMRTLLDDATRLVPEVDELELTDALAGLRPGTPDNRPLIGRTDLDGLVLATGHHRNGVLLTPITAEAVAAIMTGGPLDPVLSVADPARPAAQAPARPSTPHAEAAT